MTKKEFPYYDFYVSNFDDILKKSADKRYASLVYINEEASREMTLNDFERAVLPQLRERIGLDMLDKFQFEDHVGYTKRIGASFYAFSYKELQEFINKIAERAYCRALNDFASEKLSELIAKMEAQDEQG